MYLLRITSKQLHQIVKINFSRYYLESQEEVWIKENPKKIDTNDYYENLKKWRYKVRDIS